MRKILKSTYDEIYRHKIFYTVAFIAIVAVGYMINNIDRVQKMIPDIPKNKAPFKLQEERISKDISIYSIVE